VFQLLQTLPFVVDRLLAWDPSGRYLSAEQETQSLLIDTVKQDAQQLSVGPLGPWSVDGSRVLGRGETSEKRVYRWPSLEIEAVLPDHAWVWDGNSRLLAIVAEGICWAEAPSWEPKLLETDGSPWQLIHPTSDQVVGLRWREDLGRTELVTWLPGFPVEVMTRPGMEKIHFHEWAWNPGNDGWAGMASDQKLLAWSYPPGHPQAEIRREAQAGGLIHAGRALLWLTPEELRGWSFSSQEHHAAAVTSKANEGARVWDPVRHRLAVASSDGVEVFSVIPDAY